MTSSIPPSMPAPGSGSFSTRSGSVPVSRRKRRGFFDFVLVLALGYGVYAKTPIGAVVETAVRVARGQKDHPSWFATFKGRETDVKAPDTGSGTESPTLVQGALPASVVVAAEKHKVDIDALAALLAVRGSCDAAGLCTMLAPDRLPWFVPGKTGTVDVDVIATALAQAQIELATKNSELAIEALFTGPQSLSLALEQARKSNLDAPDDVEVHAPFLTPATRRGPLQGALAVLLMHRLRTLAWPAEGFRVTSPYGERIHPVTGLKSFHNGTDIGTPVGTALHSAHGGNIKRASKDSISGNYVIVDHGLGVQTTYCHMNSFAIAEKERITRAAILGESGATGRITGPHLHYILRINDKTVNAEEYGRSPTRSGGLAPVVPEKKPEPVTTPTKKPLKKDPKKDPANKEPTVPATAPTTEPTTESLTPVPEPPAAEPTTVPEPATTAPAGPPPAAPADPPSATMPP